MHLIIFLSGVNFWVNWWVVFIFSYRTVGVWCCWVMIIIFIFVCFYCWLCFCRYFMFRCVFFFIPWHVRWACGVLLLQFWVFDRWFRLMFVVVDNFLNRGVVVYGVLLWWICWCFVWLIGLWLGFDWLIVRLIFSFIVFIWNHFVCVWFLTLVWLFFSLLVRVQLSIFFWFSIYDWFIDIDF